MTAPVPIAVQIAEVERELIMRDRAYPGFVARGSITDFEARERVAHLQAALATLRFVSAHVEAWRTLARYLRVADLQHGEAPSDAEREALRQHPAVAALLTAFPEADLGAVRPVTFPAPEPDPNQTELFAD